MAKRILFVCIENSSCSVMAEAFAEQFGLDTSSAGTIPSTHVNPLVAEVMKEEGIYVSRHRPKEITGKMIDDASLVVLTDGSLEGAMPKDLRKKMRKKQVTWNLPDPQGKSIEEIRFIRDLIRRMTEKLANSTDPGGSEPAALG